MSLQHCSSKTRLSLEAESTGEIPSCVEVIQVPGSISARRMENTRPVPPGSKPLYLGKAIHKTYRTFWRNRYEVW